MLGKCTNPYIKLTESDAQLWMVRSFQKVLGKTKTKVMCSKASDKIKYTRPKKKKKKNQTKKAQSSCVQTACKYKIHDARLPLLSLRK